MTKASGSETRSRTHIVAVRVLPEEAAIIAEAADRAGLAVGAYVRRMALGDAGPRAMRRPQVDKAELARLLGTLGRIGSNVNQMARVANSVGVAGPLGALQTMQKDLREVRDAILRALERRI